MNREEICWTNWFMYCNKSKKYIYIFLGIKNNMIAVKTWRRTISYPNLYPVLNYNYSWMFVISWSKISWNRDLSHYDHPLKCIIYLWHEWTVGIRGYAIDIIYRRNFLPFIIFQGPHRNTNSKLHFFMSVLV